jgi:hypothetical protein
VGESWDFSDLNSTTTTASLPSRPVGPPSVWLVGAAAGLVVGAAFGLLPRLVPWNWVVGWLMGGFAGTGMLAAFTLVDSRRRADSWYAVRPLAGRLRGALILVAIAVVALNAWRFADWWSRR